MTRTTEWWQEFFAGPWSKLEALGYPQERTWKEVDFLVSALELSDRAQVLDIPCGIGRHSVELARRGFRVTGIDLNASALGIARKAASYSAVDTDFIEQDMRQLNEEAAFDAAFNFYSSFGYFEDEKDDLDLSKRIARALRPGGRFLIDTHVTESVFPMFKERHWAWAHESRTMRVLEESRWNLELGRIETEWAFVREEGGVETALSSIRLYSYRELCELLRAAGFRELRGLVTGTEEPFELGSKRLALIARK